MRTSSTALIRAILLLVLMLLLWGFLVTTGVDGSLRGLFHPRVYSRALGTAVILLVMTTWHLWTVIRGGRESSRRFRVMLPLLLPIVLVPAAMREPRADFSGLDLTPGGRVLAASGTNAQARSDLDFVSDGEGSELLAAVAEVTREQGLDATGDTAGDTTAAARSFLREDNETREVELARVLARPAGDPIVIGDDDYARIIDLIWAAPGRFAGRTVEVVAFVFRRPQWRPEHFTAARLSIWCCLVDAAVIGLLAEGRSGSHDIPREGEWIRIRGTLGVMDRFETGSIAMHTVPVLRDISWETVAAPAFEYVFPADW